ncbi:hypothetical protein ACHQM5_021733 [Ranunculus cassubicifolius]
MDFSGLLSLPENLHSLHLSLKKRKLLDAAAIGENVCNFVGLAAELDDGRGIAETVAGIKDSEGRSSLHLAAAEGNVSICRYLIDELKFDPDLKDDKGDTPLHHASIRGRPNTTVLLIGKGANPDVTNDKGLAPLHYAAQIGDARVLRLLLSRAVNVDALSIAGTPLQRAACRGDLEAVTVLLHHHANPNICYPHVVSPLMASITVNSLQCVKLLLEAGANPNAEENGVTPLSMAASEQDAKIIRCLLKAGANPNVANREGMTPIEIAVFYGNCQGFQTLFPVTSPIPTCANWSFEGISSYLHSKEGRTQINLKAQEFFEETKSKAKDAFVEKDYNAAMFLYTKAMSHDPLDPILLSNRSLCWASLKNGEAALTDALACIKLKPDWPKAHYRAGSAWRLLGEFGKAADAFFMGLKLDPINKELRNAYQEAVEEHMKSVNL